MLLERDRDQSNITYICDILDSPRKTVAFYMKGGIAKTFSSYAHRNLDKSMAECLETALLEYMERNPLKQVMVSYELRESIKERTLNDRVQSKILCNKIENTLSILDRVDKKNNQLIFKGELEDHLLRAIKLKSPSEDLVSLIERAEEYL